MGYILCMQTVVELPSYIAKASRLMSKEERSAVIDLVASNPDCGDVIVGTGGVRKVRIAQKGKGKSGSYRVVYYFCNDTIPVFLITCFGKSDKSNISKSEKNTIKKLVQLLDQYGD